MKSNLPHYIVIILFALFFSHNLSAQESPETGKQLFQAAQGEKVYLHLDRNTFLPGDTIWAKAYLWFGYEQLPDTASRVLHLELFDAQGKVLQNKKLLIENGTANGYIRIDSSFTAGKYFVRAYTRWMQNPDAGEPFYQTITVNSPKDNFMVDYSPVIVKNNDGDSLEVRFRFLEMNTLGDLNAQYKHPVNYTLSIGDKMMEAKQEITSNANEEVFRCRLPKLETTDSTAVLNLSINDERLSFQKQIRIPFKEHIDVQFFPEGGALVDGIKSRVAFKAIGSDGLSREVRGFIKNEAGDTISRFVSSLKGMGSFEFKPEVRKSYFALIEYNHQQYKFSLPVAQPEGCVMKVSEKPKPFLVLKSSLAQLSFKKYIVGTSSGKIRFVMAVDVPKDSCFIPIPKDKFPEGIGRLTVLNHDFKPLCERLFYVEKKNRIKVEVIPDSLVYKNRSKVTLTVKATRPDGSPAETDLSMAVLDRQQVGNTENITGIQAYKLLESELKGFIENPDFYFKSDSSVKLAALDLLLLTQGYRRFLSVTESPAKALFQPEKAFEISGKLEPSKKKKNFDFRSIDMTLFCQNKNSFLNQFLPDSTGTFKTQMTLIFGKGSALLQAKTPNKKPLEGRIVLDEPLAPPQFNPPFLPSNTLAPPSMDYIRQLQAARKAELSQGDNPDKWHITLKEVTVKGRDRNWRRNFASNALKIVNLDSIDPNGNRYKSLYDLLIREFGGKLEKVVNGYSNNDGTMITISEYLTNNIPQGLETVLLPCITNRRLGVPGYYYPIYVIDDYIYFNTSDDLDENRFIASTNSLSVMRVNEIKRIMVLPPKDIAASYADPALLLIDPDPNNKCKGGIKQSLVVIETYSKNTYRGNPVGIKTFLMDGLDAPRAFYAPRYDRPVKNNSRFDGRATLFWSPSIKTDSTGTAKVDFYTGDRQTDFKVIVNGIGTYSGYPAQGETVINSTAGPKEKLNVANKR
ncbi:MAG: hypothetical protein Q8928_01085 [Bacteroidota bacterium]|nr:hypothetical protein [Bacteroidota bacterium]